MSEVRGTPCIIAGVRAAIVAVGSELLGTDRLDTNSLHLTEALWRHGVEVRRKAVVGDSAEEISLEVRQLLGRLEVVIVTGGLGPTADDVTREGVAAALERPLRFDEAIWSGIVERFRRFGREPAASNRRQAERIEGADWIPNPRGSAPGMTLRAGGATLFLFPGVPVELDGMIAANLEPWLAERSDGGGVEVATLKVACLPESDVEERIAPAYAEFGREAITVLAAPGEIRLRLTAAGRPDERRERLEAIAGRLAELVGPALFARDEGTGLEGAVGEALRGRGETLATAESCTGGLIAERITRVPGASDYFLGAAVVYSDRLKREALGVSEEVLAAHGAVSEPVARAMASGVRCALASDYGLGVTGVAGPGGGSEEKPVGTVHLALAGPDGAVEHRLVRLPGDRERVRWMASQWALEMLRRRLLRR